MMKSRTRQSVFMCILIMLLGWGEYVTVADNFLQKLKNCWEIVPVCV